MTPAQFKEARQRLGLSQKGMADLLGVSGDRTVRKWEDGEREISPPVILLLKIILKFRDVRIFLGIGS